MPTTPPRPGTVWVRCWKPTTGPEQKPGRRWEQIDADIAPLVEQLQRSPDDGPPLVPTSGCCAGHHTGALPHVLLEDGSVLAVLPDLRATSVAEVALSYDRARRDLGLPPTPTGVDADTLHSIRTTLSEWLRGDHSDREAIDEVVRALGGVDDYMPAPSS